MFEYFYNNFFYKNEKEKDIIQNTFIHSPSTKREDSKGIIKSLFKENKKAGENIEKCKYYKTNKKQVKLLNDALTELFNQSTFMLKQINKLNNSIDNKNKYYIQEMITNLSQINNIFVTVCNKY